ETALAQPGTDTLAIVTGFNCESNSATLPDLAENAASCWDLRSKARASAGSLSVTRAFAGPFGSKDVMTFPARAYRFISRDPSASLRAPGADAKREDRPVSESNSQMLSSPSIR